MRLDLLAAGVAALTATGVHGVVGGRWMSDQLRAVELPESRLFGDADVGRRVFGVSWHVVTALLGVVGGALIAMSAGWLARDAELLGLVCVVHSAALVVGLTYFARRLDAVVTSPIPVVFATCMLTVAVVSGLAAS